MKTLRKKILSWVLDLINLWRCKSILKEYSHKNYQYDAAVCAIVKDEEIYLEEWIDYHLLIGFQHIFLIDNNDDDGLEDFLSSYILNQHLTVINFRKIKHVQSQAYEYVSIYYGENVKWMAFIDADEFFVLNKFKSILDFLKEYESYPAVGVNWKMYGANGQIKHLPGKVMERFLEPARGKHAEQFNRSIKSIVRPILFNRIYDASFRYAHRWTLPVYNERGERIKGVSHDISDENIVLNHYYTKSYEEFSKRCNKGDVLYRDKESRDINLFFLFNEDLHVVKERMNGNEI